MTPWPYQTDLSASRQPQQEPSTVDQTIETLDKHWFNRPFDFLSSTDPLAKQLLFDMGEKREFKREQLIFNAGTLNDSIYILQSGRVKIFQLSSVGKEVILWFCFPGEIFGLAEMLHNQKREVYAQACSDVEVLEVDKNQFKRFLLEHPAIALNVIDWLSCRLRELGDVLLNLAVDDVTSRVIKLITRLSTRYGKKIKNEIHLDIPLTHQEMADMIGASRQTVTVVLGKLRRQGVLRIENRVLYIQNPAWVESISNVAPDGGIKIKNDPLLNPE